MYIDGDTATRYKFDARKYFSRFAVLEKTFILCDSMTCLCDADLMIGVEEMEKYVCYVGNIFGNNVFRWQG